MPWLPACRWRDSRYHARYRQPPRRRPDAPGGGARRDSDLYDGRGNLWRVQYAYSANLYDRQSIYGMAYGAYDLIQGIYDINAKPILGKYRNGVRQNDKYFTPKGMARSGIR